MTKRKRGRPRLPVQTASVSFRLPKPVKSALQRAADARGETLTDYAVGTLTRAAAAVLRRETPDLKRLK